MVAALKYFFGRGYSVAVPSVAFLISFFLSIELNERAYAAPPKPTSAASTVTPTATHTATPVPTNTPTPSPTNTPQEFFAARASRFLGPADGSAYTPSGAPGIPTPVPEETPLPIRACSDDYFVSLGYGGEALGSLWKTCDSYPQPSYCGLAGNTCENQEICRDWSAALDVSVAEDGQCAVVVGFSRWHTADGTNPPNNPEFRHGIRWSYDAGLQSYVPEVLSNKIGTPLDLELHVIPRWVSQSGEVVVGQVLSRRPSPFDGSNVQQRGFYWKEGATCPADAYYHICRIVDLEGPVAGYPWGPVGSHCQATAGSLTARYNEGDPNLPSSYDILGYGTTGQGKSSITSEVFDEFQPVKQGMAVCLPKSTQGDPQAFYTSFQGESSPALSVGFANDEVSAISANGYAVSNQFDIDDLPVSVSIHHRSGGSPTPTPVPLATPTSYPYIYGETISPDGNYVGGYGATFNVGALGSLTGLVWNRSTGDILHQLPSGWEGCGEACKGASIRDLSNNGVIGVGAVWVDSTLGSDCTWSFLGSNYSARAMQAFIWLKPSNPGDSGEIIRLWDYLQSRGMDNPRWGNSIVNWEFCDATAISADGTTITGVGIHNREGIGRRAEAFVVHLSSCIGYCGDGCCEDKVGCKEQVGCPADCIVTPRPWGKVPSPHDGGADSLNCPQAVEVTPLLAR